MIRRSGWLDVELRHLIALQAVGRNGSFRQAANDLGYVQSAVSQQVAFLERRLGVQLVHRPGGPRAVSLTVAGELVVAHSDDILRHLRMAEADLAAVGGGRAGVLRIGVFDHVAAGLLPTLVRTFARRWPALEMQASEVRTDAELLRALGDDQLDVAFADLPLAASRFSWSELFAEPYVLVVPAASPWAARRRQARREDLVGLELVRQRGCRHALRVESVLRARGLRPTVVRETHSIATVQALVGAGIGAAFLPRSVVNRDDTTIASIGLGRLVEPSRHALAWRADRSRSAAARALEDVVRAALADGHGARRRRGGAG